MISFNKTNNSDQEYLRINRHTSRIQAVLNILKFQDAETLAYIAYCPALGISGYGETHEQAFETMNFSLEEMFKEFVESPSKQMEKSLVDLGWKHSKDLNKVYSKAYVDYMGELRDFNAIDGKVECLTLEAL